MSSLSYDEVKKIHDDQMDDVSRTVTNLIDSIDMMIDQMRKYDDFYTDGSTIDMGVIKIKLTDLQKTISQYRLRHGDKETRERYFSDNFYGE